MHWSVYLTAPLLTLGCGSTHGAPATGSSGGGGMASGAAGLSALAGSGSSDAGASGSNASSGNAGTAGNEANGGNAGASGNAGGGGAVTPGSQPTGTHFLDTKALLGAVDDPQWFVDNIPFFEAPDDQIQGVYYYRFQVYKEHLVYTGPVYGYLSTEFLHPVSYGAPYGGVVAAAGHQITEGRWLRTEQYAKDDIDYWLNGPGQFPKAMVDGVNADTADWAHEYSFWAASSLWQQYLATGDRAFAIAELPALVRQFEGWANHFDATLGLYWQVPVWDATEFSPSSYESSDPYHGGAGFRPTINAYQYGDARAIAAIATLKGDTATASKYASVASALQTNMQKYLWDAQRQFFYDLPRDNNASRTLLDTREEMGFVPWMFDMPQAADVSAFAQLLDKNGFASAYGPPTAERRSTWFMHEAANCCRWDGPSWPYETAQTLTGLANLLDDYAAQTVITAANYLDLLHVYALTQHKNGAPYVAEAHDPDSAQWIYDSPNGSEDYNHSTFDDLVIAGLVGLRGQADDTLVVKPLAPATWDYFALENVLYHGHEVTVLWDRTGTRYKQGTGLLVFVDGKRSVTQADLSSVTVQVGAANLQSTRLAGFDVAANGQRFDYGTTPSATHTSPADDVWRGIDGIVWREGIPENTRWTSYGTSTPSDTYGLDFKRQVTIDGVELCFYDDGGGVRVPASYDLQYYDGTSWLTGPKQTRTPSQPAPNAFTLVSFAPLAASQLRVVAPNAGNATGWGLSEFKARSKPIFQIVNVNSGLLLSVPQTPTADAAQAQQLHDAGTLDQRWQLIAAGAGAFKLVNLGSGLVLAVANASRTHSALVQQHQDSAGPETLWSFVDTGNGQFKIKNQNSSQLLAVDAASKSDNANVVQFDDNGTADHLWTLRAAADSQLFFDDFETANASQWRPLSGTWATCQQTSKEYCGLASADSIALNGLASWRNYTIDALLRRSDSALDSGMGLVVRAADQTHYYVGELNQEADGTLTWDISKNDGGTLTRLAHGYYAWASDATTQVALRFAAQGGTLSLAVVSSTGAITTLGTALDLTFASGSVGLRTRRLSASFDAVRVRAG
jgi:hypothetical protein